MTTGEAGEVTVSAAAAASAVGVAVAATVSGALIGRAPDSSALSGFSFVPSNQATPRPSCHAAATATTNGTDRMSCAKKMLFGSLSSRLIVTIRKPSARLSTTATPKASRNASLVRVRV